MSDRSPSHIPAISDAVVEAACAAYADARYGGASKWPDDFPEVCWDTGWSRDDIRSHFRAAISAAIAADREERCIDIESLKAENADLVKLSRANATAVEAATETITHLRADREASRAEIERLKAELAEARANHFITRVERDGAEDHASETAEELREFRARHKAVKAGWRDAESEIDRLTKERDEAMRFVNSTQSDRERELTYALNCLSQDVDELNAIFKHHGADEEGASLAARFGIVEDRLNAQAQRSSDEIHRLLAFQEGLVKERDAALYSLSIAEQATRTALESIPIAMTAAVAEAVEVLKPFANAVDGVESFDPLVPDECACLRASFDYFTRHLGRDNEEMVERDSVRVRDLRAARAFVEKHSPAIRNRGEAK